MRRVIESMLESLPPAVLRTPTTARRVGRRPPRPLCLVDRVSND
jgi:hypothetical protein